MTSITSSSLPIKNHLSEIQTIISVSFQLNLFMATDSQNEDVKTGIVIFTMLSVNRFPPVLQIRRDNRLMTIINGISFHKPHYISAVLHIEIATTQTKYLLFGPILSALILILRILESKELKKEYDYAVEKSSDSILPFTIGHKFP